MESRGMENLKSKAIPFSAMEETWWWCSKHRDGKGMYVRHKPENHVKWLKMKKGVPRFVETDWLPGKPTEEP